MEFDTHELAWAAGFFDGEGHTSSCWRGDRDTVKLIMSIGQNDPILLFRFQDAVNNSNRIAHKNEHISVKGIKTNHYGLQIDKFESIQLIMCLMWKWLGPIKREQYKKAIKLYLNNCWKPKFDKVSTRNRENWKYGSVVAAQNAMWKKWSESNKNIDPDYKFVNPFLKRDE